MGLDFFQRSVEYVKRYQRPGQRFQYTIQTNGIVLDDAWCAFFKEHGFLVGLSIDGPRQVHDAYRVDKSGKGTFDKVKRAWERSRHHQVDVNILCAVHAANQDRPLEVYRFFRDDLGTEYLRFIPIVERVTEAMLPAANQGWGPSRARPLYVVDGHLVTKRSVQAQKYGKFLIAIFDEWVRRDVGKVFIQHFDSALANWLGIPGAVCIFAPTCGQALALEHTGDLYACDHFVEPDYWLGSIRETPMLELVGSPTQTKFGLDKRDTLPRYCRECQVRFACHGECPKNRFSATPDGEPGLNYLCAAYKAFFTHVNRPMQIMAELLRRGRYADEVMPILAAPEKGI
jgi:uncharacterized protein